MSGQDPNARTLHAGFLRKPDFKRMQQLDLLTRLGRVNSAVNEKAFASSRWFSLGSDGFLHYGKDERSVNKGTKGRKGYIKVCVGVSGRARSLPASCTLAPVRPGPNPRARNAHTPRRSSERPSTASARACFANSSSSVTPR
jgi:hypothetical protein